MECGAVIEVAWVARRAIQTKCLARKSLPSAVTISFGELDSFIGTPIGEAMYQDTVQILVGIDCVDGSRELCLLKG